MISHPLNRTIFAACMLIALAASARADVVRCIDDTGAVTFTDLPCKSDSEAVAVPSLAGDSAVTTKAALQGEKLAMAEQARAAAWAAKPKPARGLALDAATIETARLSMIAKDHAAALARQQASAQPKTKKNAKNVFTLVGYL